MTKTIEYFIIYDCNYCLKSFNTFALVIRMTSSMQIVSHLPSLQTL